MLTVRRYITQDTDIEASKALLDIVNAMTRMDKERFISAFNEWYNKYHDVMNERVRGKRIKKKTPSYMRPRLRSAYFTSGTCRCCGRSMTGQRQVHQIRTMLWKGFSPNLKSKARVHRGVGKENRKKLLGEYMRRMY